MKRRTFIQHSALAATGGILLPSLLSCNTPSTAKPIGIQLYTLKDIILKDVKGTLQQVANIGFKELEAYSYGDGKALGLPYQDFISMVNGMGMKVVSGHYVTGQAFPTMKGTLVNEWERAVEDAAKAGQKYMIIAWLHPDERKTLDDYKRVGALMNKANEVCKQAGITLGYHNHEFEFIKLDDQVPYDILVKELDPSVVLELDMYWTTFAEVSALELFKKYAGRIHLWHVKDMDKNDRKLQTDVGSGSIDYKQVFAAAQQSGMKHFFLEQEYFTRPQIEAITLGYNHLKKIL
ncbi:MAG TPA: sugar phosphate isomerase/epimerase [Cyclobacteriaceae bacterium]|nr:sugar phosphate isomerase/epimerase [Cyclobacteriaceae bacterium]HRJ81667.1 sugar phosphate isomerase/epimerase [Cyclobacteriaceae bacterium]